MRRRRKVFKEKTSQNSEVRRQKSEVRIEQGPTEPLLFMFCDTCYLLTQITNGANRKHFALTDNNLYFSRVMSTMTKRLGKYLIFVSLGILLALQSCTKSNTNDTNPIEPPIKDSTGNGNGNGNGNSTLVTKEKLISWWESYKGGSLNTPSNNKGYPLIYLGPDSFYMQRFLGVMQPGEWIFFSDSISINGVKSKVGLQNGDSVVKFTNGIYTQYYLRKDSTLILSNDPRIITIAGTGTTNYNGENVPARSSNVNSPEGIALDNIGNIYFSEMYGQRIRKINASDNKVSTIAGDGTIGFSGDGSISTNAKLANPGYIIVDANGNLIFADRTNNRIRKINSSDNKISTIAGIANSGYSGDGGLATDAKISLAVGGLAVDIQGNLYIADTYNHRIRKIMASSGIITTIAGTGNTSFNGDNIAAVSANINEPRGLAIDAQGNIFFADSKNNRIRKISVTDGKISTVAGTGNAGFLGDGSSAINASLNLPYDVKLDPTGNLFVADLGNQRVRKIEISSGLITTVAGNGTASFTDGPYASYFPLNGPAALVFNNLSELIIADRDNNRIRKLEKR